MKKRIVTILIVLFFVLAIPLSVVIGGFCMPAQYGATYYGALPKMYHKLKGTQGKKIIVVGNSAIAFGLDPELVEAEIDGYTVCPFGLYGAIGTKAMMDLSRVNIGEGDVVILAPEILSQSLSLYFNSDHVWNAVDGDFEMLKYIKNGGEMVGGFFGYVGRKYGYLKTAAPVPTDVYASASFNDDCKMIFDRPYNQLPLGYDGMNRISYQKEVFSRAFADYVNEYNSFVTKKGATLLYGFSSVNLMGIELGTTEQDIDDFYNHVDSLLDCEILGNPNDYIFDKEWFYDHNVHLNSAGSVVYTRQLVKDLKVFLGDDSPIGIELPQKPQVPDDGVTGETGKDGALFTYEQSGSGWHITGLTEEGKGVTSLEIPAFYQGKKVISFDATVFAGNTVIEEIHLGKYIYGVPDASFDGCVNLKRLYASPDVEPSACSVYFALLKGAPVCKIYVPQAKVTAYASDYFWARYGAYIVGY